MFGSSKEAHVFKVCVYIIIYSKLESDKITVKNCTKKLHNFLTAPCTVWVCASIYSMYQCTSYADPEARTTDSLVGPGDPGGPYMKKKVFVKRNKSIQNRNKSNVKLCEIIEYYTL